MWAAWRSPNAAIESAVTGTSVAVTPASSAFRRLRRFFCERSASTAAHGRSVSTTNWQSRIDGA